MEEFKRYEFVFVNDLGDEFPASERVEFDGEYVKYKMLAASMARESAERLRADVSVADCNEAETAGRKVGELLAKRTEERDASLAREAETCRSYDSLVDRSNRRGEANESREAALREELEAIKKLKNFSDAVACVFDMLKFAAANTSCKEWDDQLEDLAQDVIEFAPEYKKQWKDICALQQRLTVAEKRGALLSAFAKEIVDAAFEGGSLDGSDIQDIAVKHDLLRIENRTEECGEACACVEFGFPIECYRKTDLSALKPAEEGEGS